MTAPALLGRFELVRPLGRGAAGEVFLARDPLLDRIVAVKAMRLDPSRADMEDARKRFLREAKITARLSHPHIVVVHEFGEQDGVLFLAMEYVAGGTLLQRMQKTDAPFPLSDRVLIMAEVAEALAYAHGRGVVHRDLKPANVLLSAPDFAKVSDFGIGKLVGGEADLTASGEMVGSPAYMSPEQMRGEPVDARSDLFSFGVLLYQVFTGGKRPFPADTLTALVRQVQNEPPPDPRAIDPSLPAALSALALRCLEKDPAHRPRDAAEVGRTLRTFLPVLADASHPSGVHALHRTLVSQSGVPPATDETVRSARVVPPPASERTAKSRRRARVAAASVAAVIGVVAISSWAYFARAGRVRVPPRPAAAPTPDARAAAPPVPAPTATPFTVVVAAPTRAARRTPASASTSLASTTLPVDSKLLRVAARSGVRLKITPDQARVFVDGRYAGIADDWDGHGGGALLTFATPGRRTLRIAAPERGDVLVELEVSARAPADVVEVNEKMLRGRPSGPTGPAAKVDRPDYRTHDGVRFAIREKDAEVIVDGRSQGLASAYRDTDLRLAAPAVHEVTIRSGAKKAAVRVLAASSVAENATVDEYLR